MKIREVKQNKKDYLALLLLADEQESMIDRYIDRGTMYVLEDGGVKCECIVTDEGNGILEIKNIATEPEFQRNGYAKKMVEYIAEKTKNHKPRTIRVPLNDKAKAILAKYADLETRLLPKINQNIYNRQIKKILKLLGIDSGHG